jgi:hypothetical protein
VRSCRRRRRSRPDRSRFHRRAAAPVRATAAWSATATRRAAPDGTESATAAAGIERSASSAAVADESDVVGRRADRRRAECRKGVRAAATRRVSGRLEFDGTHRGPRRNSRSCRCVSSRSIRRRRLATRSCAVWCPSGAFRTMNVPPAEMRSRIGNAEAAAAT